MEAVEVHRRVEDIAEAHWRRLTADSPFASPGWLRTIETHYKGGLSPRYFCAWLEGRLVGVSIAYLYSNTAEVETIDDVAFGRLRRAANGVGATFLPALVCGSVFGCGWHLSVDAALDAEQQRALRERLVEAIEGEAEAEGARAAFLHVLPTDRPLRALLQRRGYLGWKDVLFAQLEIAWGSYEEYLEALPRKQRKTFRGQSSRYARSGGVIDVVDDCRELGKSLYALADENSVKHNCRSFAFRDGFFEALKNNMGEDARIFRASTGRRTTGVGVVLCGEESWHTVLIGVNRGRAEAFAYFELTYRAPIEHAISQGVKAIHYGRAMYEVKRRRGCRLDGSTSYCRLDGWRRFAAAAWFKLLSLWNQRVDRGSRRD